MNKLLQFFQQCNDSEFVLPQSVETKNELLESMTDMYRSTLAKNYLVEDKYESGVFGCSQMGKPSIITAWDYFYGVEKNPPTFAQKRKWLGGHMFELDVYYYLTRLGYNVFHQVDVQVSGLIQGHPDFVVNGVEENSKFVVECKHVDDTRYKHYKKYGMDNQQYQTQLALYCSALKCDGVWVIGNACTGEMMAIFLPLEQVHHLYTELINRAHVITTMCKSSRNLVEVLQQGICPPMPRKRKDGTWYIPPDMYIGKGQLHPACSLYNFYEEDGKYYVTGLNYPVEARGSEPDWVNELW